MRPGPFAEVTPNKTADPELPGVTRLLALAKNKSRTIVKAESENNDLPNNNHSIIDEVKDNGITHESKNELSSKPEAQPDNNTSISTKASHLLKSIDEEYWTKELVSF